MSRPCLAFVESNTSGTGRLFARRAVELGFRPALLAADPGLYDYSDNDSLDVIQVDTGNVGEVQSICESLACNTQLSGITSSSEYFIAAAASVARALGLPGPSPDSIQICRDKWRQRTRLKNAGIRVPRFRAATSIDAAVEATQEVGLPAVVKPVSGSGSVGVKLCQDRDEVAAHAKSLLSRCRNERGLTIPRKVLVEEFAIGPEYSIESFGGLTIGITKKHLGPLPDFVEMGHDYPAALSFEEEAAVAAAGSAALKALGLDWGPAHCELRLAADGPTIIEVNPRLAGGFIPELVRLAHGIDLITQTIRASVRMATPLEKTSSRYASVRFLTSLEEGVLVAVDRMEAVWRIPGVKDVQIYVSPGMLIKNYGDFRSRVGHVIAAGDNGAATALAAEQARDLIQLVVKKIGSDTAGETDGRHGTNSPIPFARGASDSVWHNRGRRHKRGNRAPL